MKSRRLFSFALVALLAVAGLSAQVTLDSCRQMALHNNTQMRIAAERIRQAGYQKDEAFAAYLPAIDFNGGYMYNSRKISIFDSDQFLPTKSFNPKTMGYEYDLVTNPVTGEPVLNPATGEPIPSTVAVIPKKAMEYDVHNVFFGAVTLTQPIFMGGKIVAMNKITRFAEQLARAMHNSQAENIIYAVDGAYWQVVSLRAKKELAESYVALLDTLHNNVQAMIDQGVATPSDLLTVDVKLNSARVDLVKVENGLVLSRMALAELCGLPVDTQMTLADESLGMNGRLTQEAETPPSLYNMEEVYDRRNDVHALELGVQIRRQQSLVARSDMLPTLALTGGYAFMNPNMYDGFKKRFSGAWHVGAVLHVPLWHWGGNYNKYRAAKVDATIAELELQHAREMIDLQVNQAAFKSAEAMKTYEMTLSNIAEADENLRHARLGYKEGVMTTQNVLEAQTAWLKAYSEKIDAMIDVHLCDVYLRKALGTLTY